MLTDEQIERYSRQIILPEVGGTGQERLLNGSVLIVGAGGLGSPCAYYLAAAGVGRIGIVDSDKVELNNLQRQILHSTPRVGMSKAVSAARTLGELNPDVEVEAHDTRLTKDNIRDILDRYDVVVDGTDNFPTRYLINDACVMYRKPLFSAAILRFSGQATTIIPHESACYRCIFPSPPPPGAVPSCQQAGIIGVTAGIMGLIQANEVIKFLLQTGNLLTNKILIFEALEGSFRTVKTRRNPACSVCGESPSITDLIEYTEYCTG